jgi:hypothetical protein
MEEEVRVLPQRSFTFFVSKALMANHNFFTLDIIATSFLPALSQHFAIRIALGERDKNRFAQLLYWKQVFLMITSQFYRSAPLRVMPQENRYWKTNFTFSCCLCLPYIL